MPPVKEMRTALRGILNTAAYSGDDIERGIKGASATSGTSATVRPRPSCAGAMARWGC